MLTNEEKQICSSTFQKVLSLKSHGEENSQPSSFGRLLKIQSSQDCHTALHPQAGVSSSTSITAWLSRALNGNGGLIVLHVNIWCRHESGMGSPFSFPASLLTDLEVFFISHRHCFLAVHPLLPLCSNALHMPHLCQLQTSFLRSGTLLDICLGSPHQQGADYVKSLGCRLSSLHKSATLSNGSQILTSVNTVLMPIYPSSPHERQL